MPNLSHKDFSCLLNLIESINKIKSYTSAFSNADELYEDTKSFDAVIMNFVVIGEMAEKLSDDLKHLTEAEINWLRSVDLETLLHTITLALMPRKYGKSLMKV
jgi:uncharacterized protein with HEPN domain